MNTPCSLVQLFYQFALSHNKIMLVWVSLSYDIRIVCAVNIVYPINCSNELEPNDNMKRHYCAPAVKRNRLDTNVMLS